MFDVIGDFFLELDQALQIVRLRPASAGFSGFCVGRTYS
jgi:hypothetical protein